ncbi:hypothetical protein AUEXF2481DRAFT_3952 [Aureobasidium subglaciale EXF-2481]|uniref:Uncharacterized protein n=1 Tax=Aureobasidium subglaciale (strain EXF-2481) TaxID=1043005 RepID=A0A074YF61_AURSE|nr:uncharacterized protein AUEXF2481DRAFT_3952 [Aureobasidium subglaciale EXF-2481]KAI5203267.1 hypothetical protein E4T38_05238 [Aureobasidium subglaciale]KAI5220354.1 hypothetical protein E4T40_06002 [Aureobasidium subglaciale]KAI5222929.1 hypothetical protein E4T41_06428 [Aureobasidium subglaciale]KAI5260163.1 hypothetical protein E4T46_06310 [Aureobasidium subglaciale]KEQ96458.1 hypothetical protein AUEXF2481DRAFT_3952 [Aureobasidium subglaciale EXF-2481]
MPGFTPINSPAAQPLAAESSPSRLPSAAASPHTIPDCVTPEKSSKRTRKSPTHDKELLNLTRAIQKLKIQIMTAGGHVKVPPGLSDDNSMIVNIRKNGLPKVQSRQGTDYDDDELDFVICAAGWVKGAKSNWQHEVTAACVGRTCQAVRVAVLKMRKREAAKRAAERVLEATRNRDSMEDDEVATTSQTTPSMTDRQLESSQSSSIVNSDRQPKTPNPRVPSRDRSSAPTSLGPFLNFADQRSARETTRSRSEVLVESISDEDDFFVEHQKSIIGPWHGSGFEPGADDVCPNPELRRMYQIRDEMTRSGDPKWADDRNQGVAWADEPKQLLEQVRSPKYTTGLYMLADVAEFVSFDSCNAPSALGLPAGNDQGGSSTERQQLPSSSDVIAFQPMVNEE